MSSIKLDTEFLDTEFQNQAENILDRSRLALSSIQNKNCTGSQWLGWYDYPRSSGYALLEKICAYGDDIKIAYDLIVVIGIGGSYLGCRAVSEALSHQYLAGNSENDLKKIVYIGTSLSDKSIIELLEFLDAKNPIVNVVSKTGETTETAIAFGLIEKYMIGRYGADVAKDRIVVTTDAEKGLLRALAKDRGYRSFEVPNNIGGRFSVLSAVGLLPLFLAGHNIRDLLKGADSLFSSVRSEQSIDGLDHPVLRYACFRNAAYQLGYKLELLAYSQPKMSFFAGWWQQLYAESEGKSGLGLFPIGASYSSDLHSIGQMVQDGPRNMIETFLSFRNNDSKLMVTEVQGFEESFSHFEDRSVDSINSDAMLATKIAHSDGGVPCVEISAESLDAEGLGELFAFFQLSCGISAAMLGVNPYDQPAVESYKTNLFGLLGKKGYESIGASLNARLNK